MKLEMEYLPKSENLMSPDFVEDRLVPREYGEMMAHRKYFIGLKGGDPQAGFMGQHWKEPSWRRFEKRIRKETTSLLRKHVAPSNIVDGKDIEDYETTKSKKWVKFSTWFSPWWLNGTPFEMDVYCRPEAVMDKKMAFRAMLKQQLAPPMAFVRRSSLEPKVSAAEAKARGLLKEIIGPRAYIDYFRRGFVAVKSPSGKLYHVRGGHEMIEVRDAKDHRKVLEKLCVVFKDHDLPYTDALIMRLLLIQNDEFGMRAVANVYTASGHMARIA